MTKLLAVLASCEIGGKSKMAYSRKNPNRDGGGTGRGVKDILF